MVLIFQALFIPAFSYDWSFHYLLLTEGTHYSIQFLMNYFVSKICVCSPSLCSMGDNLYLFLSRGRHLLATFQMQYCYSSSGDEVDCLRATIFLARWLATINSFSSSLFFQLLRWCFCIGPHRSAVVLLDHGYPSFENFDSTIPIDVFGMKSYRALYTLYRIHMGSWKRHRFVLLVPGRL